MLSIYKEKGSPLIITVMVHCSSTQNQWLLEIEQSTTGLKIKKNHSPHTTDNLIDYAVSHWSKDIKNVEPIRAKIKEIVNTIINSVENDNLDINQLEALILYLNQQFSSAVLKAK